MPDVQYCEAADVEKLAGELAVDLRTDDDTAGEDAAALVPRAIDYASRRVDFYCVPPYSPAGLAGNGWVRDVAVTLAVYWLCLRRLNDVPGSVAAEREERLQELQMVREGKAQVPGAAPSRRPVTVTNQLVDLRRANGQVRTDRSRSTGAAKGYRRPTDPTAEALGDR